MDAGAGNGYTYQWSTGETTQTIIVSTAGSYSVDISVPGEICAMQKVFVIEVDTCYLPLQLPDVFTPNGDGVNDTWVPYPHGNFEEFEILVYNRWGTMVYKTTEPNFAWDGKNLMGNPVTDGVYFYIAHTKYQDKIQDFNGTVTVLYAK